MKCSLCCKTVSAGDCEDVQFALGKQPKKIFDLLDKFLGLNNGSGLPSEEKDGSGNVVVCGTCYTNAFVKAKNELPKQGSLNKEDA